MEQKTKQVKTRKRRITQILLAFFGALIIGGAAIVNTTRTGYAANVNNISIIANTITATSSGDADWTWKNNILSGSVKTVSTGGCNPTYPSKTGTVILTNISNSKGQMTYSINKTGGGSVNDINNGRKVLAPNETVEISVTSKDGEADTTVITISDFVFDPIQQSSITFLAPLNGTYTVNGTQITEDTPMDLEDSVLLAAVPNTGYEFIGWKLGNGDYISYSSTDTVMFTESGTLVPEFALASDVVYSVGNKKFTDLQAAIDIAQSGVDHTIIVVKNAIVPADEYTIPNGVTLLVPCDDSNTLVTNTSFDDEQSMATEEAISEYRSLTLSEGSSINVEGSISVASKVALMSSQGQMGKHGTIYLNEGSAINLESNSKLYAFGYIKGSGVVNAKSEAKVYEFMSVGDYPGSASNLTSLKNAGVFPFAKYTIRNIEAKLRLYYGATEDIFVNVYGTRAGYHTTWVSMFAKSNALFTISANGDSYLEKSYNSNRQFINVFGDLSINPMSASITALLITVEMNTSATSGLPIPYNFTVTVESGTTTINESLILHKGSLITVKKGATAKIISGKSVYVLDSNDDTFGSGSDATLDINGTFIVEGGLYTSTNKAVIKSSGVEGSTGTIRFQKAAGGSKTIAKKTANGTSGTISVDPAWLCNKDGSYTVQTAEAAIGDEYKTCFRTDTNCNKNNNSLRNPVGVWEKNDIHAPFIVTFMSQDGLSKLGELEVQPGAQISGYPSGMVEPTKAATEQFTYNFEGWSDVANSMSGTPLNDLGAINSDMVLYAAFSETENASKYKVTWKNGDSTLEIDENVEKGSRPEYNGEIPTKASTDEFIYTFSGWSTDPNAASGNTVNELDDVTDNVVFYAIFTTTTRTYIVTWKNGNETIKTDSVPYGTVPEYNGMEPTKSSSNERIHYDFVGWKLENTLYNPDDLPPIQGDTTFVAEFREYFNGIYEIGGTLYFRDDNGELVDGDIFGVVVHYDDSPGTTYDDPDGHYYYVVNRSDDDKGIVVRNAGLVAIYSKESGWSYYYFGENNWAFTDGWYYCDMSRRTGASNDESGHGRHFESGYYLFDSTGKIISGAPSSIDENGVAKDALGNVCEGYGLFQLPDGHYYYATEDGSIVKNGTFYVERTNGLKYNGEDVEAGLYYFDTNGYMHTIANGSLITMTEVQA